MEEKTYIVVGDNNYWYSTFNCKPENLQKELEAIKTQIENGNYNDDHPYTPNEIFAYEAKNAGEIEINNED